jgi:hypothetical protein
MGNLEYLHDCDRLLRLRAILSLIPVSKSTFYAAWLRVASPSLSSWAGTRSGAYLTS